MGTINIEFPFDHSNDGSYVKLTNDTKTAIRSDLLHLLLTQKGERLYLPDFGTNLRRYLFDQNDNHTISDIKDEINQSLKKYMPKLLVTDLTVSRNEIDSRRADVTLRYDIENSAFTERDEVTVIL